MAQAIWLNIKAAKDLSAADKNGFSDPFVVAELIDSNTGELVKKTAKKKTKTIKKNLNPIFNDGEVTWTDIPSMLKNVSIRVTVNDADTFSSTCLGVVIVPLSQYVNKTEDVVDWFKLKSNKKAKVDDGQERGAVQLSIRVKDDSENATDSKQNLALNNASESEVKVTNDIAEVREEKEVVQVTASKDISERSQEVIVKEKEEIKSNIEIAESTKKKESDKKDDNKNVEEKQAVVLPEKMVTELEDSVVNEKKEVRQVDNEVVSNSTDVPSPVLISASEEKTNHSGATSVWLNIKAARDLIAADKNGFSDPYVIAELINSNTGDVLKKLKKKKTKTIKKTLNPVFNDGEVTWVDIPSMLKNVSIRVTVNDADTLSSECLGVVIVPLSQYVNKTEDAVDWFKLESNKKGKVGDGQERGAVQLSIRVQGGNIGAGKDADNIDIGIETLPESNITTKDNQVEGKSDQTASIALPNKDNEAQDESKKDVQVEIQQEEDQPEEDQQEADEEKYQSKYSCFELTLGVVRLKIMEARNLPMINIKDEIYPNSYVVAELIDSKTGLIFEKHNKKTTRVVPETLSPVYNNIPILWHLQSDWNDVNLQLTVYDQDSKASVYMGKALIPLSWRTSCKKTNEEQWYTLYSMPTTVVEDSNRMNDDDDGNNSSLENNNEKITRDIPSSPCGEIKVILDVEETILMMRKKNKATWKDRMKQCIDIHNKLKLDFSRLKLKEENKICDIFMSKYANNLGDTLISLNLKGNLLINLPNIVCKHLTQLKILILSNNELKNLPENITNLHNTLELIAIDHNQFSEIPLCLFESTSIISHSNKNQNFDNDDGKQHKTGNDVFSLKLMKINASYNMIEYIPPEIGKCKQLQSLLLSNNKIKTVSYELDELIEDFLLEEIDLVNNPCTNNNCSENIKKENNREENDDTINKTSMMMGGDSTDKTLTSEMNDMKDEMNKEGGIEEEGDIKQSSSMMMMGNEDPLSPSVRRIIEDRLLFRTKSQRSSFVQRGLNVRKRLAAKRADAAKMVTSY